ncbi:E3 ubiquitin-protein ligase NRDP1-like [Dermacentor albipictus]|uniref:E3 ubiquitin-protein ligase NRDP1-like n=1 Tax=Dermacentor albipictus TaxID=60249 RepID=UPI0038FCEF33
MTDTTYTLSGFGGFLERRRVTFVEPLPAIRVCSVCGLVPCSTRLLACDHVLCDGPCGRQVQAAASCPLHGRAVPISSVVPLKFEQSEVEQLLVRCLNGPDNCTFVGKLNELEDHLSACECDAVECPKCGERVCRNEAASHCETCCDSAASTTGGASGTSACSAVEQLARMKQDLEKLREIVSKEETVKAALVNDMNSLAHRAGRFESQLMSVAEEIADLKRPLPEAATNRDFPHVLNRGASGRGCPLTLCKLGELNSRPGLEVRAELCTLQGYIFRVSCTAHENNYKFWLTLCSGPWDDDVEWPFAKCITLTLPHPEDKRKDIRLSTVPLSQERCCIEKPQPCSYNGDIQFEEVGQQQIYDGNYLLNGNLHIIVEFM